MLQCDQHATCAPCCSGHASGADCAASLSQNVNSTDELRITITNDLRDGTGTALHSHGMFFNNTAYYDGAVGVTQCPIPQGQSLTYEPLNSPSGDPGRAKQWGTFWR